MAFAVYRMKWKTTLKTKCTHCGECCMTITCSLGQAIFLIKEEEICPAIEIEGGLYYCGLISNTKQYISDLVGTEQWKVEFMSALFCKLVGIDIGCTNGEKTGKDHICPNTIPELIQLSKEVREEDINPMGYCQTCEYSGSDGDYGEISTCDAPTDEVFNDGRGDTCQCPLWKSFATLVYCSKHKRWHYSTWELSCKECYAEWEKGELESNPVASGKE